MILFHYHSYNKKLLVYFVLGILIHLVFFFLMTCSFSNTKYDEISSLEEVLALPIILTQAQKVIQPKKTIVDRPNETVEITESPVEEEKKEPPAEESVDTPPDTQDDGPPVKEEVYASFYSVDKRPSFINEAILLYPLTERKQGKEGFVILIIKVDKTGRLRDIRITKSGGENFDAAAIQKIEQSSFSPGYKNGAPVNTEMRIKIVFTLR